MRQHVLLAVGAVAGEVLLMTLAGLAVLVIVVLLLVWLVRAGDRGPNRFGEDPLGAPAMARPL